MSGLQGVQIIGYMLISYWILAFITALYQFSMAYCISHYYFTPPKEGGSDTDRAVGFCSAARGCFIGLTKHIGSLAFGALLVAIAETIQAILKYLERQNRRCGNRVTACLLSCLRCCVGCCESILKFINKLAYIDIAVLSHSFCGAVRNAMNVVGSYGAAMVILNGATLVVQVIGSCLIVILCGMLANFVLTGGPFTTISTTLVVACAIAFLVAWAFMIVFDMTVDTLLYCFAVDNFAQSEPGKLCEKVTV
jgi:choline transporter-like protein 2/4/5